MQVTKYKIQYLFTGILILVGLFPFTAVGNSVIPTVCRPLGFPYHSIFLMGINELAEIAAV